MQRAFRVVTPLAIHQEPVMVRTWREFNRSAPDAILAFLHVDGFLLPLREIAGQLHAPRDALSNLLASFSFGLRKIQPIAYTNAGTLQFACVLTVCINDAAFTAMESPGTLSRQA